MPLLYKLFAALAARVFIVVVVLVVDSVVMLVELKKASIDPLLGLHCILRSSQSNGYTSTVLIGPILVFFLKSGPRASFVPIHYILELVSNKFISEKLLPKNIALIEVILKFINIK